MDSETPKRVAHIRIGGGRISCASCCHPMAEVVLLEPGRPLCLGCAGAQAGVSADTIRDWLRSGQLRGALRGS